MANATGDKYNLNADVIRKDLSLEVPQWILSAYGPGSNAPAQLFGGYPREQSFEELRLRYYLASQKGNEQQVVCLKPEKPFPLS